MNSGVGVGLALNSSLDVTSILFVPPFFERSLCLYEIVLYVTFFIPSCALYHVMCLALEGFDIP